MPFLRNFVLSYRYWSEAECDPRLAYHNCLVWCYERLSPDEEFQRAIMEYDPIDYLSLRRKSITIPTAAAFFTFACKSLRRFEDSLVSTYSCNVASSRWLINSTFSLKMFPTIFVAILIVTSNPSLIIGSLWIPISCGFWEHPSLLIISIGSRFVHLKKWSSGMRF